ncbi:transcriptional regulator, PadR family [Bryocella elongata]|uniref:Transcriptional regulator, PadR family n=1 Tax=Bryocella elongata TaxID=863522 RepID=A0A1H5X3W4_9BACT|nr:PadR family transcriptional regulator [Bryocella elongata]SEG06474.1 transcriptional regulator, PadR family [Bryocella elongata]
MPSKKSRSERASNRREDSSASSASSAEDPVPIRTTATESLLGWLSLGPMSGYDIRQKIESSTANFWSESFGQIYPALKKLSNEGLVTMRELQPEGQRLRKEYRITPAGKVRLREWLAEPCGLQVRREELLLKLFFGDKAPKGAMRAAVEQRLAVAKRELESYGPIERELAAKMLTHPAAPYWQLTLEFGKAQAAATRAWCEQTLRELDKLEKAKTRDKGGRRDAR